MKMADHVAACVADAEYRRTHPPTAEQIIAGHLLRARLTGERFDPWTAEGAERFRAECEARREDVERAGHREGELRAIYRNGSRRAKQVVGMAAAALGLAP